MAKILLYLLLKQSFYFQEMDGPDQGNGTTN